MPISREVCSQAPQPVLRHDQVRLGCVLAYHEGARLAFRAALVALGGIAVVSGVTVGLDVAEDSWRSPGVLVTDSVIRSGNGETFSEVFSEALPAGVEFDLVETRPGWHHIEFADGRTGWVRTDHAKLIGS